MHHLHTTLLCSLFAVAACGDKDDGDEIGAGLDCTEGFTLGDDGYCYEDTDGEDDTGGDDGTDDEPPTLDEVLDSQPDCELLDAGDEIDLSTGCAGGLCPGITYDRAVEDLGEPDSCSSFILESGASQYGSVSCDWGYVSSSWTDNDIDGEPDASYTSYSVSVSLGFEGASAEGIGLGASMSCLLDELGLPDGVDFAMVEGEWVIEGAAWDSVSAYDRYVNKNGDYLGDGFIDTLYLYGD